MRKLTSITHLSLMAALLLSLSAPVSAGRQPADAGRVDPLVLALAAQQPETLIDVIVQKASADVPLAALIERLGGQVTWDLPLIGAIAARLPAAQARQLAAAPEVQSVALDAAVHATDAEAPAGLLREDFTIGVNVAAGAGAWSSGWDWSGAEWHELGEADGPVAGDVAVTSFLAGDVQGLRLQGAGRGLQGGADLSQAAAAQLSLAYRRKDLAGAADFVRVEASGDGGQTWSELGTLAGPATDESLVTVVYDLSGFVVADFAVRLVTAETFSPDARFYVDALQVEYQPLLAPAPDTHAEALTHQLWLPALQSASAEAATGVEAAALQLAPYTLRDDFTWMSYSNNSGTHRWKTNWIEADA
ncbi:MAG: hypothetical protein JNK29_18945, partial [Anaerolineales bacterium]|nr:hypothetical protein [Anaerolineales bacterium]